jgi:hypothetical protein
MRLLGKVISSPFLTRTLHTPTAQVEKFFAPPKSSPGRVHNECNIFTLDLSKKCDSLKIGINKKFHCPLINELSALRADLKDEHRTFNVQRRMK